MIAAADDTLKLLACGIAIAGGLVLLFVIWSRQRGRGPLPGTLDRRNWDAQSREHERLRSEIEKLAAELRALSHDIVRQLDERQAGLEKATAQADERIASLRAMLDVPVEAPAALNRAGPPSDAARQVYELADRGMNAGEIARHVGRGIGEVELVLNLRRV